MIVQNPVLVIAILLAAAVLGGMVAHRLRQPVILGYLVIGAAVGPQALGLVNNRATVETLATIGVALLMFTLGLETSFSQLRQNGRVGLLGGLLQIAATFIVGSLVGVGLFRWPVYQSALFGLIISLSSTAVCLKILVERGELDSVHGRIMIAILILQDIGVVAMTVVVPLLGSSLDRLALLLLEAFGKAVLFSAIAIVSGLWVLPWVMGRVGGVRTRELFLLVVLALCLGAALGTQIFGLSSVFGAFLIGLVLHESKFAHHALAEITPLRDIFATLFFVSLGMLFDVHFLASNWPLVLLVIGVIIAIKFGIVYGIILLFGFEQRIAVFTGASLFQIGEFGFILAQAGLASGVVSTEFYSLIVAATIITMLLTPLSMNLAGRLQGIAALSMAGGRNATPDETLAVPKERVLLAGYGRIGENVARGLEDAGVDFVVIDIDSERVKAARAARRRCFHGDASNPVMLGIAGVARASVLAVTFPDPIAVVNTVKTALELNPRLKVVARVHREHEARRLSDMAKIELVSPEYEASLEFVKRTLAASGWQPQDIERTIPSLAKDRKFVEFAPDDEH